MDNEGEKMVLFNLKAIARTVLTAFLITTILMGALALLICYTPISEEAITPSVYALNYFSVFVAGLLSAARAKKRGFVTGGLSGAMYMLLVYALGYVLFGGIEFTRAVLMNVIYCLVLGIAGGVVGINIRR